MSKIHLVVGQRAGFAREDPSQAYVVGAYTNPRVAQQVKLLASGGASIQEVEINSIWNGLVESALQMGFSLDKPVRWQDIQKQLFERYAEIAQDHRDQMVSRLGVELYNRVVRMCGHVSEQVENMSEDKANRWLGFVQGMLVAAGVIDIDTERNLTRPLFHKLHGPVASHEV